MSGRKGKKDKDAKKDERTESVVPAVIIPEADAPAIDTPYGKFDLDDYELPEGLEEAALISGGFPYEERLDKKLYEEEIVQLQIELVKLQKWVGESGARIVTLFEGRDAAGKGSTIFVVRRYLNPRSARVVALAKPSEQERRQWYFQRYAAQLPTGGEMVLFDRSWYNRAVVEPVMGFCKPEETETFLEQAPLFEKMIVDQGLFLFKFWLDIGREMQLIQFHERRHDPLKIWKLSPVDYASLAKWDEYTVARDRMLQATHRPDTPWVVVKANDKRRSRLAIIRHMLARFDYPGRDDALVTANDPKIIGVGPDFLQVEA